MEVPEHFHRRIDLQKRGFTPKHCNGFLAQRLDLAGQQEKRLIRVPNRCVCVC
jgi:hypothetical protein